MIERIRHYFIIVFLMVTPLIYFGGKTLRDAQENFFQYASICILAAFVGDVWIGAFLILNLFLFVYHGALVGSLQVMNLILGCVLFMCSRAFFKKNKFEDYYKYLLIITVINILWMSLQLFRIDPIFIPQNNGGISMPGPVGDPSGFFGIKMANGIFLSIILPILASVNIWLSPFLLVPIALSASSGVALSVAVVVPFYLFFTHRRLFIPSILALLIGAGFFIYKDLKTDPMTFTSRFPLWSSTAHYALHYPLGFGPDSYANLHKHKNFYFVSDNKYGHAVETHRPDGKIGIMYWTQNHDYLKEREMTEDLLAKGYKAKAFSFWDNPHNGFLKILFENGILGILLLLGFMSGLIKRFKSVFQKDKELVTIASCLLVYFVSSLTQFPLDLARTAYLFPILLGAYYAKTDSSFLQKTNGGLS